VVVSEDYDRSVSAEEIKRKASTNVKGGSVILFREWRVETYEQMPASRLAGTLTPPSLMSPVTTQFVTP